MQSTLRKNEFIQALAPKNMQEKESNMSLRKALRIDKSVPHQVIVWHQTVCLFDALRPSKHHHLQFCGTLTPHWDEMKPQALH